MKKRCLYLVLIVMALSSAFAQGPSVWFDLGSWRNQYAYPISEIGAQSGVVYGNLRGSLRLRSYGTWALFSRSAYDFTPVIERCFVKGWDACGISMGAGIDVRMRLVRDVRSTAETSAEPLLTVAREYSKGPARLALPLWVRFYDNGTAISLLPRLSYQAYGPWKIFFLDEVSWLSTWTGSTSQWRHDIFLGVERPI